MGKVIVYIEGGVVQSVLMDEDTEIIVVDYDTDSTEDEEELYTLDGEKCYAYRAPVDKDTLIPHFVEQQFDEFNKQTKINNLRRCFKE